MMTTGAVSTRPLMILVAAAAVTAVLWRGVVVASAFELVPCEWKKCTPNCICDLRVDVDCARDYGNYGWYPPEGADEYVYHFVRPSVPIEYYEIKPAGMRGAGDEASRVVGKGNGIGTVMAIRNESLVGQVYFEVHPDQLGDSGEISLELYGNVNTGPFDCAKGKLLSRAALTDSHIPTTTDEEDSFRWRIFRFDSYNIVFRDLNVECHPRSTGSVMAAAEYVIPRPFDDDAMWFPESSIYENERLQFCVRVRIHTPYDVVPTKAPTLSPSETPTSAPTTSPIEGVLPTPDNTTTPNKEEYKGLRANNVICRNCPESASLEAATTKAGAVALNYDTYLDTKVRIDIDRSKKLFKNMYKMSFYSNQAIETKNSFVDKQEVSVFAFLCSDKGRSRIYDKGTMVASNFEFGLAMRKFEVGQVFRICVSPDPEYQKDYAVVGFESVVCSNEASSETIILEREPQHNGTGIDNNDLENGLIFTDTTTRYINFATEENINKNHTLAFYTTVRKSFFALNETSIVCSGNANLRYNSFEKPEERRRLKELDRVEQSSITSFFTTNNIHLYDPPPKPKVVEEDQGEQKKWYELNLIWFGVGGLVFLALLFCLWRAANIAYQNKNGKSIEDEKKEEKDDKDHKGHKDKKDHKGHKDKKDHKNHKDQKGHKDHKGHKGHKEHSSPHRHKKHLNHHTRKSDTDHKKGGKSGKGRRNKIDV